MTPGRKPKGAKATKRAPQPKGKKAATGKPREGTHKAQVIAMIQRKGGATLEKITSTRRQSDGARVYEA